MKKARFLALFLALILCISALPITFAEGDTEVSIVTTKDEIYSGDNYFSIGLSVFDKNGNYIGDIPGSNDLIVSVAYFADNSVITAQYDEDLTDISFFVYSIDNGAITETYSVASVYENAESIILPSVSDDGVLIVFNELTDAFEPMASTLLDSYGHALYTEIGKVCIPLTKGCVATQTADGKTEILYNLGKDVKSVALSEEIYAATSYGDIIVEDGDEDFGVINNRGDSILYTSYEYIEEIDGYYVTKNNLNEDSWIYGSSTVYDRYGNPGGHVLGDVIAIGNGVCVTQSREYIYSLVYLDRDNTLIAKGDEYYGEDGYFAIGNFEKGATLYNSQGKVVVEGLLDAYSFSCDEQTGDILYNDANGDVILLSNGKSEKFGIDCDYAYYLMNGYITCGDYETDTEWVVKNGSSFTTPFYCMYDYYSYDGCDVIVMSDESYENKTIYIVKGKVSSAFSDVADGFWAADDILAAYRNGLMNGTGGGLFSPTGTVTRAQVVTLLWRLAGCPDPKTSDEMTFMEPYFNDVKESDWYYQASEWAGSYGIVNGVGSNPDVPMFGGDRPITRAEVVALFARFAEYEGWYVELGAELVGFADVDSVPVWATEYIGWGVQTGLITGKGIDGKAYLAPNDNLTRAELAAVANRYN